MLRCRVQERARPAGSLIVEADECHQTQDRGDAGEKPEQPPDGTSEPQGERCGESSSHDWGCECNDCGRGSQVGGRRKREGGACVYGPVRLVAPIPRVSSRATDRRFLRRSVPVVLPSSQSTHLHPFHLSHPSPGGGSHSISGSGPDSPVCRAHHLALENSQSVGNAHRPRLTGL